MHISKRTAIHGLNVSMAFFIGLSAYGILQYYEGGAEAARTASLLSTLEFLAGIAAAITGVCFFGIQLDRRKSEERREEEARKAAEARRKGRRKPLKGA